MSPNQIDSYVVNIPIMYFIHKILRIVSLKSLDYIILLINLFLFTFTEMHFIYSSTIARVQFYAYVSQSNVRAIIADCIYV